MFARTLRLQRYFSTLLIAESKQGKIHPGNLSALAAAQKLNQPIDILVLDSDAKDVKLKGDKVDNIFVGNHELFKTPTADVYAHAVNNFIKQQNKYTHIVSMDSNWTKDYFPRVAAVNDVQPVTDIIEILDSSTFRRPIYAGNAIATIKVNKNPQFLAVRPTNFDPTDKVAAGTIKSVDAGKLLEGLPTNVAKWAGETLKKSERPDLAQAKIVISGGRGSSVHNMKR